MKKSLIYIFAAAAMLAGCAKEVINPVEEEIVNIPEGGFSAVFEAPVATKTILSQVDESHYAVLWEETDIIKIKGNSEENWNDYRILSLSADHKTAVFEPVENEATGTNFVAHYGNLDITSQTGLVSNLPMEATCSDSDRKLVFQNTCAVLEVNGVNGAFEVSYQNNEGNKTIAVGGSDNGVAYVAIPEGTYSITLAQGTTSMTTKGDVTVVKNTIYPLYFGKVLEIKDQVDADPAHDWRNLDVTTEAGNLNIIVREGVYTEPISITDNSTSPRNIYVNGGGNTVANFTIYAPNAHVEVFNGKATTVTAATSKNSFIVKSDYQITGKVEGTGLIVNKGRVVVEGKKVNAGSETEVTIEPNVKLITIPTFSESATEKVNDIIITVAPTATISNPELKVKIVNKNEATSVDVVGTTNEILTEEQGSQNINRVDPVAAIGEVQYSSLPDAVAAAKTGETITLVKEASFDSMLEVNDGRKIIINLNGKKITASQYFQVSHGALTLTGEGTYETSAVYALKAVGTATDQGADYSVINVDEKVTVKDTHATYGYVAMISIAGNKASYGAKINFKGKGEGRLGLYVNGQIQVKDGNVPIVYLGENAVVKSEEYALYAAGYAKYFINGTLEGNGGLEAKAGEFTFGKAANVKATATNQNHETNGNGTSTEGYAIASVHNENYAGTTLNISCGTYTGEIISLEDKTGDDYKAGLSITGGTFSVNPSAYVAKGYDAKDNGDGTWTVIEALGVARIGSVYYETLAQAISAATAGQTVTMVEDYIDDPSKAKNYAIWIDKNIILDMNGHKVEGNYAYSGILPTGCTDLVIKNGTIRNNWASNSYNCFGLFLNGTNVVTLENVEVYAPKWAVYVPANSTFVADNSKLKCDMYYGIYAANGTTNPGTITLKGGTVVETGGDRCIDMTGNDTYTDGKVGDEDTRDAKPVILNIYDATLKCDNGFGVVAGGKGATVNVYDGAVVTTKYSCITGNGTHSVGEPDNSGTIFNINGGNLTSTSGTAIYHPQYGTLNISGGNLTGVQSAVEVRAGIVNISGGTLISTTEEFSAGPNGSGNTVKGSALVISQHTTFLPTEAHISGGVFKGLYSVYEAALQNNPVDALEKIAMDIRGGSFEASGDFVVASQDVKNFIYGGTFNKPPFINYCDESFSGATSDIDPLKNTNPVSTTLSNVSVDHKVMPKHSVRVTNSRIASSAQIEINL